MSYWGMAYLQEFVAFALVAQLALMSPGPDFALIFRNSLAYDRQTGVLTAAGIALGIFIHVGYCVLGIGAILAHTPELYRLVQYAGALYLGYLGFQSLATPSPKMARVTSKRARVTGWQAIRMGFITNVLNIKATVFFVSVYTQLVAKTTPPLVRAFYGGFSALMTFFWFALLANLLTHSGLRARVASTQHWIMRLTGLVLVALALRIVFTSPIS